MDVTVLESLQRRLEADLARVCGHLNVLHEQLVTLTREALETKAWEGQGVNTPAAWLAWQTGLSPERSRQIVAMAERQLELPVTFAAFAEGLLSVDQVHVVAARAPQHNDSEACELARHATVAQLRVAMNKHTMTRSVPAPDTAAEAGLPPADPAYRLSIGFNDDGDFYVHGLADPFDGALIANALSEARDALFTAGNTTVTWLDAFREVCSRSLGTITTPSRQDLYRVIVHLDTDGAWLHNGPALPAALRERLCCSGVIQPLWEHEGLPINLGRARHIAPLRLRRVIEDRDRICRHPTCNSSVGLEVHHIQHWQHGGTTDTHNLGLMCGNHHHRHHNGEFTITGNADDPNGLIFRDSQGRIIEPNKQPQPPGNETPPIPSKPYAHPTGEHLTRSMIYFTPPPVPGARPVAS